MDVIVIRHGSAEPAGGEGDEARRLTKAGKEEVKVTARALRKLGVKLEIILASPLVRAVETAEIVAGIHKGAEVAVEEALRPRDAFPILPIRDRLGELATDGAAAVALVGHAPSLDECIGELTAGQREAGISLSKAGAACLTMFLEDAPIAAELRWLMRRGQLAKLAGT